MSEARIQSARRSSAREVVALVAGDRGFGAIAEILEAQLLEVAEFDSPESLLARAPEWGPALIVLCVQDTTASLPGAVKALARSFAPASVVVVCSDIDRRTVRAALASGASGVLLQDDLQYTLSPCLQAVRAGLICLPRRDWQGLEPPVLSSREKQVLGLVVMGYMNSQIADQLFLAESTVKSHLSSAFGKLGVRSRHEAAARILDPQAGLGVGILRLGGEPLQALASDAR